MKLTTHFQLVPRSKNVDLFIHSPIHLHGVVLNLLSTDNFLPLPQLRKGASTFAVFRAVNKQYGLVVCSTGINVFGGAYCLHIQPAAAGFKMSCFCLVYPLDFRMEAGCSSETQGCLQTTAFLPSRLYFSILYT
jgi:hypothetical protein